MGLRKVERKTRLFTQFLRDKKPLIGKIGVLPSYSTSRAMLFRRSVSFLATHLGFEIGSLGARFIKKTVEHWNRRFVSLKCTVARS